MVDSILVGPPQKGSDFFLKMLLKGKRRQSDNEGGAATDFSGQVPLGTYTEAVAAIDEAIAAISAAASHTFNATPTTPYVMGDVWLDGDAETGHMMHRCTTARATGAYVAADWELLLIKAAFVQADVALTSPIITGGTLTGGLVRTADKAITVESGVEIYNDPTEGGTINFFSGSTSLGRIVAGGSGMMFIFDFIDFLGAMLQTTGSLTCHSVILTSADTTKSLELIVNNSGVLQKRLNGGSWVDV